MEEQIKEAKRLLENNGYIVKKITRTMMLDFNECCYMEARGQNKDCLGCSCSVCLMQ